MIVQSFYVVFVLLWSFSLLSSSSAARWRLLPRDKNGKSDKPVSETEDNTVPPPNLKRNEEYDEVESRAGIHTRNQWTPVVLMSWAEDINSDISSWNNEQILLSLSNKNISDVVATDQAFAVRVANDIDEADKAYENFTVHKTAWDAHNHNIADGSRPAAIWTIWGVSGYGNKLSTAALDALRNAGEWPKEIDVTPSSATYGHIIYANDICPLKDAFIAILNGKLSCWGRDESCYGWDTVTESQTALKVEKVLCGVNGYAAIPLLNGLHPTYGAAISILGDKTKGGSFPNNPTFLETLKNMGSQQPTAFVANTGAVAMLLQGGSVVAWGLKEYGGEIPESIDAVFVQELHSNGIGFVGLKTTRRVISWGGFQVKHIPARILDGGSERVSRIVVSKECFLAMLESGGVATWGRGDLLFCNEEGAGGSENHIPFLDVKKDLMSGVINVVGNEFAFAAVKDDADHTVITWGRKDYGGSLNPCASCNWDRTDIIRAKPDTLVATDKAFSFIRQDGRGVSWGGQENGGIFDKNYATLGILRIGSSLDAFASIDSHQGLYCWQGSSQGYFEIKSSFPGFSLNFPPRHLFRTTNGMLVVEGYDCQYSEWSKWTICNAECGGGHQSRKRSLKESALNGKCDHLYAESQDCNTEQCPTQPEKASLANISSGVWIGIASGGLAFVAVAAYAVVACCKKQEQEVYM